MLAAGPSCHSSPHDFVSSACCLLAHDLGSHSNQTAQNIRMFLVGRLSFLPQTQRQKNITVKTKEIYLRVIVIKNALRCLVLDMKIFFFLAEHFSPTPSAYTLNPSVSQAPNRFRIRNFQIQVEFG